MEKVHPWCGQPSYRGRLRTKQNSKIMKPFGIRVFLQAGCPACGQLLLMGKKTGHYPFLLSFIIFWINWQHLSTLRAFRFNGSHMPTCKMWHLLQHQVNFGPISFLGAWLAHINVNGWQTKFALGQRNHLATACNENSFNWLMVQHAALTMGNCAMWLG